MPGTLTFGQRLAQLAQLHPDKPAIVFCNAQGDESIVSWEALEAESNRTARALATRGVNGQSLVVVSLPNSARFFAYTFGAWKVGACILPLNERLAEDERASLLALAAPTLVVSDWELKGEHFVCPEELGVAQFDANPLPDRLAQPGKAIASGGSTGRPKIIVDTTPWARSPGAVWGALGREAGLRQGQVQLVGSRLYHNGPFTWSHFGLFEDHTIILMERFDATQALDLIERHRVSFLFCVPTMLQRMARVEGVSTRDLSSIATVLHAGGPCPSWVKEAWIDLVGADRVCETYGATEEIGTTYVRGDDWLRHPGCVGRPFETELRILDDAGQPLPAGEIGEIFMRYLPSVNQTFAYLGDERIRSTPDGFASVGDMGWLDSEGYLYLADRRADLILTGGVNVYPAEIEAVLSRHPDVADVAVVGLPDDDWGQRVHAIVEPSQGAETLNLETLLSHCRQALSPHKVPKSIELVARLPRSEHGKLRRAELIRERLPDRSLQSGGG
jgi:bile acid-coenzyme A ligase